MREAVVAEALTWLRTPWRHRARVKGIGTDCAGFILDALEQLGALPHIEAPDYSPQLYLRADGWLLELVKAHMHEVTRSPRPGDIVLYRYGRCVSHLAMVTGWPQVVHARKGLGVILDDALANPELAERQVGVWSPWP